MEGRALGIIGGGLPCGVFGGRADVMNCLAPLGPVYQAGTLSGNPLAMAAGREVVRERFEVVGMGERYPVWVAPAPVFDTFAHAGGRARGWREPFELTIDGQPKPVRTPLLFVGNNRYEVEEGRPAERTCLDDGMLSIYAVAPLSRTALIAAALRTLVGTARMHRDFCLDAEAREVRIEGPGDSIEVALDGERVRFDLPLTIRIRPRELAVVAPESD